MPPHPFLAHAVGRIAWDLLAEPQKAFLLGLTKRGAFYQLACDWVIFISLETFRGPLTLNLGDEIKELHRVAQAEAYFSQESVQFKEIGLAVDLCAAQVWEVGVHEPGRALPPESRVQTIAYLINHDMGRQNLSPLARLLPFLLMNELPEGMPANTYGSLISRMKEIWKEDAGDNLRIARLAQTLGEFLGLGPGLTPSGDDFVMGFLLALNRWGQVLFPGVQPAPLNQTLSDLAAIKTTALSASLIACSAQGQADERLVLAFDGIMLGEPAPEICADLLSSWGSSSGLDALAGFIIGHLIGGTHGES